MKLSPSQKAVVKFIQENQNSVVIDTLQRKFHGRTLNTMFDQQILTTEGKSRLREDDMEMVYWTEVSVAPTVSQYAG